ncbi:hypothetical protein [Laspinema olomoucense]|nr:hypothetical protein [Laspinema sp. D3c]
MVTFDAIVPIFSSSGNWRSRFNPIWRQVLHESQPFCAIILSW